MALALAPLLVLSSEAKELRFPADHPVVVMDAPDGWTTETTPAGLEMRSPEKNSIVIMNIIAKDKHAAGDYAKTTADVLKTFGVTFVAGAKPPPKPAAPKPAASATIAAPGSISPGQQPNSFTFSGAPSLATPGTRASNDPQRAGPNSLEAITSFRAPVPGGKLPLRAAQYLGGSLNGKPVDVQFVLFALPDNRYFAMMQESEPQDDRAVDMARSVKSAK